MKKIWLVLGTLFFIGYIPGPTGTYGSLVTTVIVYLLKPYWSASLYIQAIAIAGIFIIGTAAGSYLEQHLDRKDPRHCVIDELAGQMVSLLLVPHTLVSYFFAFLLFRLFDILKPFPIRRLERIPHGMGIMIDDIAAGIYALAVFHIASYVWDKI